MMLKLFFVLIAGAVFFGRHFYAESADNPNEILRNVNITLSRHVDKLFTMQLFYLPHLLTHKAFDRSLQTVVYVHGWMESGKLDTSTNAIRAAYLERGDHNVVTVDWSHYSKNLFYSLVVPKVKTIAETIAAAILQLVRKGCDIQKLHFVGHSLGGQMVGMIGRYLRKENVVVPRIYALDPAGPCFENGNLILSRNQNVHQIRKSDAAYVQIIHTNGGVLGMKDRVAAIDFYPNGGEHQPGCDVDVISSEILLASYPCNHFRSWHFYQLSVKDPKAFPAVKCNSDKDFFEKKTCFYDEIEYMGFGANLTSKGKYFLQTNANIHSLSRGRNGLFYIPMNVVSYP